jgi:hypothetical protein
MAILFQGNNISITDTSLRYKGNDYDPTNIRGVIVDEKFGGEKKRAIGAAIVSVIGLLFIFTSVIVGLIVFIGAGGFAYFQYDKVRKGNIHILLSITMRDGSSPIMEQFWNKDEAMKCHDAIRQLEKNTKG